MKEFDFEPVERLLKDFHRLTGMKICLYDREENERCFFPEKYSPFCGALRQDPRQDALCRECDKRAFAQCERTHRSFTHTCHAGLLECFSPILSEDRVVGYMVIGQIRPEDSHTPPEGIDGELARLYRALPAIPADMIRSARHVLEACAGYEDLKKMAALREKGIAEQLREYIADRLDGELTVGILCESFRMSRVELYEQFRRSFDCTVGEYIKKSRLDKACRLLRDTELPIYEIAEACGIPDYNYFSKSFKRAVGVSPREYRKNGEG